MNEIEEAMQTMSPSQREAIAEAVLGIEAQTFMASDVGRYIMGRAQIDEEDATRRLIESDPSDVKEITKQQNRIWRARSLRQWLLEAIDGGVEAEYELRQQENEH